MEGWKQIQIFGHELKLWKFASLNLIPFGPIARRGIRHSILEAGLQYLTKRFAVDFPKGNMSGELECRVGKAEQFFRRKTFTLKNKGDDREGVQITGLNTTTLWIQI